MSNKLAACLFIIAFSLSNYSAFAQKTTLWLVRHAEKQTAGANATDPELSPSGVSRAADLVQVLKREKLNTIYTTNYKRTTATVAPLARLLKLTPVVYDAADTSGIVAKALQENQGTAALIAGHSNTLLPILRALHCRLPFATLSDNDYDMLFKVVVEKNGKAKLSISHYGDLHHSTEVPPNYTQTDQPVLRSPITNQH